MASVKKDTTIKEFQDFAKEVYGLPNDRYFGLPEMLSNLERFIMRGLKGIRKKDKNKTKLNLLISLSWFMSTMNQLHIDLEDEVWQRFPFLCSYCGSCPCSCKENKMENRQKVSVDETKKPANLSGFQEMFEKIYPSSSRTTEQAGVHLAEEMGEFSEALMAFRGGHKDDDFKKVEMEAADLFSCIIGVFNSIGVSVAKELSEIFNDNCHICHKAPCVCNFIDITSFKS